MAENAIDIEVFNENVMASIVLVLADNRPLDQGFNVVTNFKSVFRHDLLFPVMWQQPAFSLRLSWGWPTAEACVAGLGGGAMARGAIAVAGTVDASLRLLGTHPSWPTAVHLSPGGDPGKRLIQPLSLPERGARKAGLDILLLRRRQGRDDCFGD